jgi:hypothetical protein
MIIGSGGLFEFSLSKLCNEITINRGLLATDVAACLLQKRTTDFWGFSMSDIL